LAGLDEADNAAPLVKPKSPAAYNVADGGTLTLKSSSMHLEESNTVLNGKWTHSANGKSSIFSTKHLGNPVAVTPDTFYAAVDEWDKCTKLTEFTNTANGSALTWDGLFQWCKIILSVSGKTQGAGASGTVGSAISAAGGVYLLRMTLNMSGISLPRFY
jgi:hypothetical protein